jgi:hypothetical protein
MLILQAVGTFAILLGDVDAKTLPAHSMRVAAKAQALALLSFTWEAVQALVSPLIFGA